MQVVLAILLLGVLVTFHELGHFLAGRAAGIYVHEFAIGMGPVIFSKQGKETRYTLRLIPIGGYNRFAGEEGKDREEDVKVPRERLISTQRPGRKAMVVAAGPVANLLIASIAFMAVFSFVGINRPTNVVSEVMAGYPAANAGIQSGDQIVAVAGTPTPTWEEMTASVQPRAAQPTEIVVRRGYEDLTFTVTPLDVNGVGVIGVRPSFVVTRLGPLHGLYEGLKETVIVSVSWIQGVIGMIVGKVAPEVTGPVGITQILGEAAKTGVGELLYLLGALSANLGLFNLLPVPALDGSRLIFAGAEALTGKPIDPDKESLIHFVGFFLLIALFVVITYKDILRLIR
ncbi:MAG: M50 family metallopeptidase [Bacillota bacterium]